MKHLIILGDGMADRPLTQLEDRTPLQYAHTPYMDLLAREGRSGTLHTVPDGFHPGSEVANLSVLGYDLTKVYEGRGVLEAASMGVELRPGDMAMRCNLICIEDERIKNHSAGHITTEEAHELIAYLQEALGDERVTFYAGVSYRHLLVIRGGNKHIACTPPHDVPGQPYLPLLPKAEVPQAEETARLLNDLIRRSQILLSEHPVNLRRIAAGKDSANSIWPWSPGYRPNMEPLTVGYPQMRSGIVISAVDLINGIGRLAGLTPVHVEGATGLYDTNYENKAAAAIEGLRTHDFVYLHIEASDEAGHEGDVALKIKTIENLDARIVRPIYESVCGEEELVCIAVLPDHPTPCALRTHTADPVPFTVWHRHIEPDGVQTFDEQAATQGSYGDLRGNEFMHIFMNL
ncbi:MAG: cofactor-independent phosphoglycerate mutase [Prevotellaceae bacterium]|jgi:2,3-bisphosphoglycerate-independent phosphoglycerate mutase|nr:cofactor-independent phosphoglycerate mutase [Prevotellaceae bacterium]